MKSLKLAAIMLFLYSGFCSVGLFAADGSNYGHVSLVQGPSQVIRLDGQVHDAVVNLPLLAGDTISTDDGRVEIQFDNGTIVRLDRNSELKIITVLAPTLTSKWKMTSLELSHGRSYSISQSYNDEMFQWLTPSAAINLNRGSTTLIGVEENGDSLVFCDRGRAEVLFGKATGALRRETAKAGRGFRISNAGLIEEWRQPEIDFWEWNRNVNHNFKALHFGVSNVPKPIYRFPRAVINFAEKWSTMYGEWIYHDLFGYVWKPYRDFFADRRPFFDAYYVRINQQLYMVPQQEWGWAPAHLGTWHWSGKSGWIWIPGNAFSNGYQNIFWAYYLPEYDPLWARFQHGIQYLCGLYGWYDPSDLYLFPWFIMQYETLYGTQPLIEDWIVWSYGGMNLYTVYRQMGEEKWRQAYQQRWGKTPPDRNRRLAVAPREIRQLLKEIDRAPLDMIHAEFREDQPPLTASKQIKWLPARVSEHTVNAASGEKNDAARSGIETVGLRDWNPDRLLVKRGFSLFYHSAKNEMVIPELKIRSSALSFSERLFLGRSSAGTIRSRADSGHWNLGVAGQLPTEPVQNDAAVVHKNDQPPEQPPAKDTKERD